MTFGQEPNSAVAAKAQLAARSDQPGHFFERLCGGTPITTMNTPTDSKALPLTNYSASWVKRNNEMPEHGQRVIAFSPVYPKGHEMRFRILDGQFVRITTEVEYWAYCEPMADSLPNT